MKKLLMIAMAFTFAAASATAQEDTTTKSKATTQKLQDCVMMKDGKMVVRKNGKITDLTDSTTVSDGTVIRVDGVVTKPDGKQIQLKDDDCVFMDGKIRHITVKKVDKPVSSGE